MATVASQLILHPVVSQGLKILSTTVGRDKVRVANTRVYPGVSSLLRSRPTERSKTLRGSTLGYSFLPITKQMLQSGVLSNLTLHWGANVC